MYVLHEIHISYKERGVRQLTMLMNCGDSIKAVPGELVHKESHKLHKSKCICKLV